MQQFAPDGDQFVRRRLAHFSDDELSQQGGETFAVGGRGNAGLCHNLLVDAGVILLVVMQALLQILGGNHVMIGGNLDGADDLQDVFEQEGREDDKAIDLLAHLIFVEIDDHLRGGGEIGGKVGVEQATGG